MAKVKVLKAFASFKEGQIVIVKTNDKGVPSERFWRLNLDGAIASGHVELVKASKKKTRNPESKPEVVKDDNHDS